MTQDIDLLRLALGWHRAGRAVAIATVVNTWGSAPCPVGSQMVIDTDGAIEGSVSGGCVEGAVIAAAIDAIVDGQSCLLDYGVTDKDAFAVGLACGGRLRILVEPVGTVLSVDVLAGLVAARNRAVPVAYVTDLVVGGGVLAAVSDYPDQFRFDRSGVMVDGRTFVVVYNPPLRMMIVGAVHIAQLLVPMARMCNFDPVVIDPRGIFGSEARFTDTRIVEDWPDVAMQVLPPDARTAVVTLSHDSKLDDPAIVAALGTDAFYIGCLGSVKTHAARVDRMRGLGFLDADIARLHGPVGLDIASKQPAEIAVSIMAEVIQRLRA